MKKIFAIFLLVLFSCNFALAEENDREIKAGDCIRFGHYEQDNDLENGPEEILWLVLEVQDEKALLLSKYGLDMIQYHTKSGEITWEECTLRKWLNEDFLNLAFSPEEQEAILVTEVDNSSSQSYWNTDGGNNTLDRLFLLSYAEANKYFGVTWGKGNVKAMVRPTAYSLAHGSGTVGIYRTEDDEEAGWWFLRSRGYYLHSSSNVNCTGALDRVSFDRIGQSVRPAFWLDLNAPLSGMVSEE